MDLRTAERQYLCVKISDVKDLPEGATFIIIMERKIVSESSGWEKEGESGYKSAYWNLYGFQEEQPWREVMETHYLKLHDPSRPRYSNPEQLLAFKIEGQLAPKLTLALDFLEKNTHG